MAASEPEGGWATDKAVEYKRETVFAECSEEKGNLSAVVWCEGFGKMEEGEYGGESCEHEEGWASRNAAPHSQALSVRGTSKTEADIGAARCSKPMLVADAAGSCAVSSRRMAAVDA
jgi:hypothetical protein